MQRRRAGNCKVILVGCFLIACATALAGFLVREAIGHHTDVVAALHGFGIVYDDKGFALVSLGPRGMPTTQAKGRGAEDVH